MNKEEIQKTLELHKLWLSSAEGGERANLTGANLYYANLQGANLQGAILHGAYLQDANLQGAILHGANLQDANLHGAILIGANLKGANLRGANLREADLRSAILQGANLYGADLRGADHSLKILKTVNGLKWDIVLKDNIVTVGCQSHDYKQWLSFADTEIDKMDSAALEFYNNYLYNFITVEYKNYKE